MDILPPQLYFVAQSETSNPQHQKKTENDRRESWGTAVQKLFHFGIPFDRIRGLNMVDYSRAI